MQQLEQLTHSTFSRRMMMLIRILEKYFPIREERLKFLEFLLWEMNWPHARNIYFTVIERLIWYYEYLMEHGPSEAYTLQELFLYDALEFFWYRDFTLVLHRRRHPLWDKNLGLVMGYEKADVSKVRLFLDKSYELPVDMLHLN